MCSIAMISFAPGSTVSRRRLTSLLLEAGETRGRDAAGYAWVDEDGTEGEFKNDVPGGRLFTGHIPETARSVIIHTRAYTHGHPSINENNHPVSTPRGDIRLVHNGVVYNHDLVREVLGESGRGLAEVDSAVIPAVMEELGIEGTELLGGYAAAAWLDRETGAAVHVARFKSSPVEYVKLLDGTFVAASTAQMLARSLSRMNLSWVGSYPSPFDSMDEGDYYTVLDGEILSTNKVGWNNDAGYSRGASQYHSVTSGATTRSSTYTGFSHSRASEDAPRYMGGTTSSTSKTGAASQPMALTTGSDDEDLAPSQDDEWEVDPMDVYNDPDSDGVDENVAWLDAYRPTFYTKDHDGDFTTYKNLATLVQSLSWEASLTTSEHMLVGADDGNLRWINHFSDIGVLSDEGDEEFSWVKDNDYFSEYKNITPDWVFDGLMRLRSRVGA